jgi:hypothetical protein
MTKKIIAAVVAGILIMLWQSLSHTMLNLHASQEQYSPNQDVILKVLSENLTAKGQYYLPNVPPGTSYEDMEKAMTASMGKPYASILYNPVNDVNMTSNLLRGLGNNILLAVVLVWLIGKLKSISMGSVLSASLGVALISFCFYPYPGFIWYQTNGIWVELGDSLAAFGLAGLWLGWYLPRGKSAA